MYVETACFDPQEDLVVHAAAATMELQLQQHLSLNNNNNTHLMQQAVINQQHHPNLVDHLTYVDHGDHQSNWDPVYDQIFDFTQQNIDHNQSCFNVNNTSFPNHHHHQTPDLLFNLLPSSLLPNSSSSSIISLADLATAANPSNLPPHHDNDDDDNFNACIVGRRGRQGYGNRKKPLTTERQKREQLNNKYQELRDLVPNPTKADKASVVGDAIEYINELLRTVKALKLLVEKKRFSKSRERSCKRLKTEEEDVVVGPGHQDQSYNDGSSRSSWLQRKSNDTEVDVRIVDDEVTIKLVQPKKIDCLLFVSKVLDDLRLDLHHVAGGQIGDYYSFLFNTKIFEGSCGNAGAIANKLLESMDSKLEGSGVSNGGKVSNM